VAVVGSDSSGNMDSARGAADSGAGGATGTSLSATARLVLAAFGLATLGIVKEN
jgi:hypothetical protein